jgi:4,5-DOPA dioxygenase extradiol
MKPITSKFMPALFLGHGSPMNVILRNSWTESWKTIGQSIPRPKAILVVSAHWFIPSTMVTAMKHPRTIYDFGGFPQELYQITYPAPGDSALAAQVRDMLSPTPVTFDDEWGFDHGAWSVLYHLFPQADIPVVQLSIDRNQPPAFHYQIGKLLSHFREQGILLLGSGNIAHNLRAYAWDQPDVGPFDWAESFDKKVRRLVIEGKDSQLVDYSLLGPEAKLSIPTPDHYLPLLYILGSRHEGERISFPATGFDGGSLSMTAVQIG